MIQAISLLDFGIIVIFIFFVFRGYKLGLIRQIVSIAALVIGFYIAMDNYQILVTYFNENLVLPIFIEPVIPTLSFALIIIIVSAVINIIGYLLNGLTNLLLISMLDDLGGAIVGFIKGVLMIYITLLLVEQMSVGVVEELIETSVFADEFLNITPIVKESLEKFIS
ncbi:CvpA family protein [Fuchsiella alkaliacetigena]|uniref:CvpA family protein n=1 Tax=Fuchsiella alkaliacetigena TaxID=957042 RepID=UPI00200AA44A|nr:CvpA family protein [Fuchsiella alkaliacetigena]MCK8825988.1 CvpA family protein [Fuchsiella alkaliacetigena]